jgi:hypothetical protein
VLEFGILWYFPIRKKFGGLQGGSHKIFFCSVFPPNGSSWSHLRCPRSVLVFFASWLRCKHIKMTPPVSYAPVPWGPKYHRVETPRCPKYLGVKTLDCFVSQNPGCPMYRGVETSWHTYLKIFLTESFWCDSSVSQVPGSHFGMLITWPIGGQGWSGRGTSLVGPGGVVWGRNREQKVSWDCPFKFPGLVSGSISLVTDPDLLSLFKWTN